MEEINYCKICFLSQKDNDDKLIKPCNCKTYVHKECIEKWRRKKIGKIQYYRCEVCLYRYKISIFSNKILASIIRFIYFNIAKINYSYFVITTLINIITGYFISTKIIPIINILSYFKIIYLLFTHGLFIINMGCIFITTVFGISIFLTNRNYIYWKDSDNLDIRILYFINFINLSLSSFSYLFYITSLFTLKFTLNYIIEFCLRNVKEVLSEDEFSYDNILDVIYFPEIKNNTDIEPDHDQSYYHMINSI